MYHWTDSKILVHAFYCMVGLLLQYIYKQAQTAWPGLSLEQMLDELRQIEQFVLLYPPQGEKGPQRAAVVQSKQTFPSSNSPGASAWRSSPAPQELGNTEPNALNPRRSANYWAQISFAQ